MADNALTRLIARFAQGSGNALLGQGTPMDATADARAYKMHVLEAQSLGQVPLSIQDWQNMQRQPKGLLSQ
jgi:hypothetical protein